METTKVVLALADISGYTRFMLNHQKEMVHGQMVIGELLNQLVQHITPPLKMIELEGDAVFIYADAPVKPAARQDSRRTIGNQLFHLLDVFRTKARELQAYSICMCNACANIEKLKLKIIVHSGEVVFNHIGNYDRLSGIDVIRVHRLLKNSVTTDEYILVTESASSEIELPGGLSRITTEEAYDVGNIKTHVYIPEYIRPDPFLPMGVGALGVSNIGLEILRYEIQQEYTEVADNPRKGFHFHTGNHLAQLLEYDPKWCNTIPATVIDSFAGTGNPFALGHIQPGDRVVDVGAGAGFDSMIAAHLVGPDGQVIGVDMTLAMLQKAETAATAAGMDRVEFKRGFAESLPVADGWADVVISNGVINLCPDKPAVFREMYRVLKPGGRIQIADLVVQETIPEEAKRDVDLWTG